MCNDKNAILTAKMRESNELFSLLRFNLYWNLHLVLQLRENKKMKTKKLFYLCLHISKIEITELKQPMRPFRRDHNK